MYDIQDIPLDCLQDNPYNLREEYDIYDIESLAKSIKERGLQNPISAVKVDDYFVIVSGHRRSRAYRYLGRKIIPAIIRKESTSTDLMVDLAVENLQRKDLSPAEKGATLEQLFNTISSVQHNITSALTLINKVKVHEKNKISFTEKDIIKAKNILNMIGISSSTAIVYIRLRLLPEDIQRNIVSADIVNIIPEGKIGVKSAYELTRIKEPEIQKQLAEKIVKDKMKHIQLKHIVDEIIENDNTLARKGATGSAERRTEDDVGTTRLTEDLFLLSSKIDSFRSRLPLVCGRLEKIQWTASLEKMKKTCMDMVRNINNLLRDNIKIEGLLEYVNADLEIMISGDLRFTFPSKMAEILEIKEGDILLLKIEGINRSKTNGNLPNQTD